MHRSSLVFAFSLFVCACGGSEPPAAPPAAATADPAPSADASAAPAAPAVDLTPLDKPKSKWAVGTASLSTVDPVDLLGAFKKANLVASTTAVGGMVAGKYESRNFDVVKGKLKGSLTLVRPAAKPADAGSTTVTPPSDVAAKINKDTTAFDYDSDADVIISLEVTEGGKAADAKRLLDQIVKKGK